MTTIHRPVYTGTGFRAYNGSGLALTLEQEAESLEQAIYDVVTDIRAVLGGPGSTIFDKLGDLITQTMAAFTASMGLPAGGYPGMISRLEDVWGATVDPATLLTAIQKVRLDTASPHLATITDVLDALAAGVPASALPDPAPSGYGGGTAAEVWQVLTGLWWPQNGGQEMNVLTLLQQAAIHAIQHDYARGWPDPANPWFSYCMIDSPYHYYHWWDNMGLRTVTPVPLINWSAWNGTDTIVDFLNAQAPAWEWSYTNPDGTEDTGIAWAQATGGNSAWWRCLVTDELLPYVSGRAFAPSPTPAAGAPVWPGIAAVTLGEAVPFNDLIEVTGPMDGVLIAYTTPPSKVSIYSFGSYTAYGRAGQLAFVSDNGQVEEEQWLQFNQALYTPKSMTRAASCLVRPIAGQEGTITPWTVT